MEAHPCLFECFSVTTFGENPEQGGKGLFECACVSVGEQGRNLERFLDLVIRGVCPRKGTYLFDMHRGSSSR
ncbi:hypothetical protein RGUI_0181 [Rhodovulum sp. P5]|nr:hypothetical protein RGUI_0181 [Rhodovulum sp. P5]